MPRRKKEQGKVSRDRKSLKHPVQILKGMHDVVYPEVAYFEQLRSVCQEVASRYGYGFLEVPVLEHQDLFKKSVGGTTDIVQKEMYAFKARGGDEVALRPEFTAGMVRAYIENGMSNWPQPVKLWTWGPAFRYENPQAGRYRQFWQIDFEYFTSADPIVDVEVMQMGVDLLKSFGIKNVCLELNSIGCWGCRDTYRKQLKNYYRSKKRKLCLDCKSRFDKNILRLLDCKNEQCQPFKTDAPQMLDYLCKECNAHFKKVLGYCEELGLGYVLNPFLVRGLDYYNRTVFEFFTQNSENEGGGAKLALGGGGRFDYSTQLLAGPETPACGFALGVERIATLLGKDPKSISEPTVDAYFVQIGEPARVRVLGLIEKFKRCRVRIGFDVGRESLRAQFKSADRFHAQFAVIIGEKEVFDNTFILRDMVSGIQETFPIDTLMDVLRDRVK